MEDVGDEWYRLGTKRECVPLNRIFQRFIHNSRIDRRSDEAEACQTGPICPP